MSIQTGTIIPALQYNDASAAIEWLCRVLGFEQKLVVPAGEKAIAHAQLTIGAGMIMLSSSNETDFGKHIKPPIDVQGINTQSPLIYIVDDEIKAHYDNAVAEGAEILVVLRSEEYGGQYYSCRDPEGYLWNIGSYDPYA